jgi:hypothetical protein
MQQEINIAISAKPPMIYFSELLEQCNGGSLKYGAIDNMEELRANLKAHCIPESVFDGNVDNFDLFLIERRKLMSQKMRSYYFSL